MLSLQNVTSHTMAFAAGAVVSTNFETCKNLLNETIQQVSSFALKLEPSMENLEAQTGAGIITGLALTIKGISGGIGNNTNKTIASIGLGMIGTASIRYLLANSPSV